MNKLIRDKIPEIMINDGNTVSYRKVTDEKYQKALTEKIREEVEEFEESGEIEELVDIYQVLVSLIVTKIPMKDFTPLVTKKLEQKGGFEKGYYLMDCKKNNWYDLLDKEEKIRIAQLEKSNIERGEIMKSELKKLVLSDDYGVFGGEEIFLNVDEKRHGFLRLDDYYPRFQFEKEDYKNGLLKGLAEVIKIFRSNNSSDLSVISFLLTEGKEISSPLARLLTGKKNKIEDVKIDAMRLFAN